jgi:hypothetical protein
MNNPGNPEFPAVDPDADDLDVDDESLDDLEAPAPGEGLIEPANVPFDEEPYRPGAFFG